jgi:3',5'-cyclic-AMP phosphodiesterase
VPEVFVAADGYRSFNLSSFAAFRMMFRQEDLPTPGEDGMTAANASRISRRRFLAGTLAAGAGLLVPRRLWAEPPAADPNRFALLSDIHISAQRDREARGINLVDHFVRVRDEVLALRPRPAAVIVTGDCAFNDGLPGDYAVLRELTDPLRQAGLPPSLMMGNHDRRQNLWQAFPELKAGDQGLRPDKHVLLIESPHTNWFLLDSMDGPGAVAGRMGEAQLQWLAKALDAHADKPALILAHHYPETSEKPAAGSKPTKSHALLDTDAFFKVIVPRKQVKAYIFGHSHRWVTGAMQGLHMVNLPTTAYVFDKKQPSGWVDAQLRPDGITLRLNALDRQHPEHGKKLELAWRK